MKRATPIFILVLASFVVAGVATAGEPIRDQRPPPVVPDLLVPDQDTDRKAPVDYGFGPGIKPSARAIAARVRAYSSMAAGQDSTIPVGSSDAGTMGAVSAPVTWPIIAIHMVLLPDGRVMNYGTDESGNQGAQLLYDVWDPSLGTGSDAHTILPNTTTTDIFCSGQSVMWNSGQVLISGGDLTIHKRRNYSNNQTTIFDPPNNTLSAGTQMNFPRWYSTLVSLPSGDMIVLGGRQSETALAPTPEIYDSATGWTTLPGATSAAAFGTTASKSWYYPRGFIMPNGNLYVLDYLGNQYIVTLASPGTVTQLSQTMISGTYAFPTIMYGAGQLITIRGGLRSFLVDLTGTSPVITQSGNVSQNRFWSSATVLADGEVVLSGGSAGWGTMDQVAYQPEIWNPTTGLWTLAAAETIPRLYHSTALLLPDATVLLAGGGAPGPVKNLNAEIFYPPYLYLNDGSGQPATRPQLGGTPASVTVGQSFTATVGPSDTIAALNFVRTGSSTHSTNGDQRLISLPFTQSGQQLSIAPPTNPNSLVPGYYMLFAINQAGVPSLAPIILVSNPS
jgi:hypothetical protein